MVRLRNFTVILYEREREREAHEALVLMPISAGGGSNKAQKGVVNKKAKSKKDDSDDDDEVRAFSSLFSHPTLP